MSNLAKVRLFKLEDIKVFPSLMEKNKVNIIDEVSNKHNVVFELIGSEEEVEEIMIYTNMEWEFAA